jgi:hypothetical protein
MLIFENKFRHPNVKSYLNCSLENIPQIRQSQNSVNAEHVCFEAHPKLQIPVLDVIIFIILDSEQRLVFQWCQPLRICKGQRAHVWGYWQRSIRARGVSVLP